VRLRAYLAAGLSILLLSVCIRAQSFARAGWGAMRGDSHSGARVAPRPAPSGRGVYGWGAGIRTPGARVDVGRRHFHRFFSDFGSFYPYNFYNPYYPYGFDYSVSPSCCNSCDCGGGGSYDSAGPTESGWETYASRIRYGTQNPPKPAPSETDRYPRYVFVRFDDQDPASTAPLVIPPKPSAAEPPHSNP
jgi:hypothetical protein